MTPAAHESGASETGQPPLRRALTKIARRTGRFLGVTDLAHSVDTAREQIAASESELSALSDEIHRRVQMLEEEQLRLQQARAVWVTSTYLAATRIPEEALISVVLPTRNRGPLVGRAIASVLAQSYEHWELIVVVDGDDATFKVLEGVTDQRIRVLYQEHRGLAAARNAGLDKACGDFVVYLDDDNVMYEQWLRGVAWAFSLHPEADVMIGARLIDDEYRGRQLASGGPPHLSFINALDRAALMQENQADVMQLAHRRDLAERFDAEDGPYEDWGFLARVTKDRQALCFPALAGVYTTTADGRLMDSDSEMLERQVRRVQTKLS